MLSRLVWTRGLWVFSLAACSCPVLHMAGDLFAGHVLVFFFVWAHGFCLSFLCVMCYHVNCLDPPIVLPDYWLICPTCVSLVTLLICSLYNLLVFAVLCQFVIYVTVECVLSCPVLSCPVLSCPVLSCPVLSCPVLSCPVLSCPVLSCPVLSCPVLSCPVLVLPAVLFFPFGVVLVLVLFIFY